MSWWKVGFGHKRHSIISYALTSSALPVAYSNSLGRSWWPWSYRGTSKGGRDGEKKAVSRWETPRLKCSVIVKTNWKPRSRGLKTSPRDPVNLCLIWSIDIRGGMDWKRPITAQRHLNIHTCRWHCLWSHGVRSLCSPRSINDVVVCDAHRDSMTDDRPKGEYQMLCTPSLTTWHNRNWDMF